MAVSATGRTVRVPGRPRFEGVNIRTWVGFKHFMYLAEEAVVQWFREAGTGPGRLYHEYGLGLEIIDSSVQLPAVLDVDDQTVAEVTEQRPGRFQVLLRVPRPGGDGVVLKGKVTVALVREGAAPAAGEPPAGAAALVVPEVAAPAGERKDRPAGRDLRSALGMAGPASFLWSWRARYFHCHYSDRVQHSAYIRALEETVDRFLADREVPIGRMLAERGWIPVVSRARVRLLADAHLDEQIHTTFSVVEVLKGAGYDARMDCYVRRGATMVHTASARILHGYAVSRGPAAGRLAELDEATVHALTGGEPA